MHIYIPKIKRKRSLSLSLSWAQPPASFPSPSRRPARPPPSQPGSIPAARTPRQGHASPSQPHRIPSLTVEPRSRSRSPRSPPRCAADRWTPPNSSPLPQPRLTRVQTAARARAPRSPARTRRGAVHRHPPVPRPPAPLYMDAPACVAP